EPRTVVGIRHGLTCQPTERCCASCWHPQHAHQASFLRGQLGKAVSALAAGPAVLRRTVEADVIRLRKYEVPIKRVARRLCLDPALIAAIISQESRAGLLLNNGWDQGQQRYGLMQIDRRYYQPYGTWDSEEHINQCSSMLVAGINEVRAKHPAWNWERQLRGGICTYHARAGNLQIYDEDPCSSDNNYVNSVISRAQYFKRNGF
uniref:Lysozyme g n=1 Tax=Phasianus colchicus TaxID=9054 RepID=A0A669QQV0_PHACC